MLDGEGVVVGVDSVAKVSRLPWTSYLLILLVGVTATAWLVHRLDHRFLWQDEAMTAVLGERLMKFGRPMGYDGKNLITMDIMGEHEEQAFPEQTTSVEKSLAYYVARKDFKADTTWTGHPLGQSLVSGLSTKYLGKSTWSARLPFALAGALAVMVLAEWMERMFRDRSLTLLSVMLLLGNVFWFSHMRQCRYYALTCLFTLLILRTYWGWRQGGRWSSVWFVVASWLMFQCDFGTFFPLMGALFIYSWVDREKLPLENLAVFTIIGLSILPFIFYYEALDRKQPHSVIWFYRFAGELFVLNQYTIPLVFFFAAYWLLYGRPQKPAIEDQRFLLPILIFVPVLVIWVSIIVIFPFYRYIVSLAPLGAGMIALLITRLGGIWFGSTGKGRLAAWVAGMILVISPVISSPISAFLPDRNKPPEGIGFLVRPELAFLYAEHVGSALVDPNQATYEFLHERLKPGDEVLINYEDIPMMFYLDCPIRGGPTCFRVGERQTPPPRYIVLRRTAQFHPYQWREIEKLLNRCRLKKVKTNIPDTPWGNCPDPFIHYVELGPAGDRALVYECLGWK